MSFRAVTKRAGPDIEILMAGVLDENADIPDFQKTPGGAVRIDLGELTMINSLGCRRWVQWIKGVSAEKGVSLVNCSPAAVHQIGILVGFLPENVKVDSFFVPYTCNECNKEFQLLFKRGKEFGVGEVKIAESAVCPACKGKMTMDVIPSRYFKFLQPAK